MKQIILRNVLLQLTFIFMVINVSASSYSQSNNPGAFERSKDFGKCLVKGSDSYDAVQQEYTISGSGDNKNSDEDAFHFLYKNMKGDYILQFEFKFTGTNIGQNSEIGWMIRNDSSLSSANLKASVHKDGLTAIRCRLAKEAANLELKMEVNEQNNVLQLERCGNRYVFSAGMKGQDLKSIEFVDSARMINNEALVGIFICSHDSSNLQTAEIRNMRITIPFNPESKQHKEYIGSNLEIMDIETGNRQIKFTAPNSIQAPNWTKDGKSLLYNSEGKIYNFDLKKGQPTVLDTKFATQNNNDHVLSFDGKTLGLSNSSENKEGKSQIFIVPVQGGTPILVTEKAPSYLHGFSPDGNNLLFTGGRKESDNFEIYSINIKTKKETRLTNSPGLDDGSEYSPDGKYIYFNSVRSGKMQIWRMKPDGSLPERITNDTSNNWFPHVSPNGKWIVYLAFGNDVLPGDHPFYKHVSIRLIDLETNKVRILAHLYGGQGTMNVPGWSPDSKKIAFVSNTDLSE